MRMLASSFIRSTSSFSFRGQTFQLASRIEWVRNRKVALQAAVAEVNVAGRRRLRCQARG